MREEKLVVEIALRDFDDSIRNVDEAEGPPFVLSLHRDDLLHVERSYDGYAHASIVWLEVRDPTGVVDSFRLEFCAHDANNPDYWIEAFIKLLRQELDVQLVEHPPIDPGGIPF